MTVDAGVAAVVALAFLASAGIFYFRSRVADESDVLDFIQTRGEASSLLLVEKFGPRVYSVLRRLAKRGRLVRVEGLPTPVRGDRPVISYRFAK